ncbi:MAG: hypothetical protein K2X86_12985 [Cytophagaceae bacterium]|nr:hypothetical protein [Cytophagaceae bacterium]
MKVLIKILFATFIFSACFLLTSFKEKVYFPHTISADAGVFTYMVNDKMFTIENMKASLRNTTSGRKELSLSNDRFVKFFFIDPIPKDFDLSTHGAKQAIVRYNEPGTNNIYSPKAGHIRITNLDENQKMLSGEFEMELIIPGKEKIIRVTKGQFNCPIINVR